jgi:uncharacterized RDD family membrane protein YckC
MTAPAADFLSTTAPDPDLFPEVYEGVVPRRVFAYFVDLVCIAALAAGLAVVFVVLWLLSLGLLGPLLWFLFGLLPLAYHTLQLAGPHSATLGMRLFDLELRSLDGERPGLLQALAQSALFYLTVGLTGSLVLLAVLLNQRRRTVHDWASGTLMVRRLPAG